MATQSGIWEFYYLREAIILSKALRVLDFLIRTVRHGVEVEAMRIVYTSLIVSIVEYGCVVLSPVSSQLRHI